MLFKPVGVIAPKQTSPQQARSLSYKNELRKIVVTKSGNEEERYVTGRTPTRAAATALRVVFLTAYMASSARCNSSTFVRASDG
jgi:ribosomal protein L15E